MFRIFVSNGYFYGAEKLVLLTVNFTRFGKLVSANVIFSAKNIHLTIVACISLENLSQRPLTLPVLENLSQPPLFLQASSKLGSVTAIPISVSQKNNSSQSQGLGETKLKIKKTKKKKNNNSIRRLPILNKIALF
jgi:hypothetical protein